MSYRVTIVGRGPAGLACAIALADTGRVAPGDIVTVDPRAGWVGALTDRLRRLGITHLRSSTFQHPDRDVRALDRYIDAQPTQDIESDGFLRYPSTSLFRGFCDQLVRAKLAGIARRLGEVTAIRRGAQGFTVTASDGATWSSRHVVLATNPRAPRLPAWALGPRYACHDGLTHTDHVRPDDVDGTDHVVIVGGGSTAAELALAAAGRAARTVLLSRRTLHAQRFDVSPGWMSATVYGAFLRVPDPAARLRMADAAARGATVPPRVLARLRALAAAGGIELREAVRVTACRPGRGRLGLSLSDGSSLAATRVWIATGSVPTLTRGPEIALDRPMALLGRYPILDGGLRVPGTDLFLVGAPARTVIGPTAGNLHGHRHAAARVAAAITR